MGKPVIKGCLVLIIFFPFYFDAAGQSFTYKDTETADYNSFQRYQSTGINPSILLDSLSKPQKLKDPSTAALLSTLNTLIPGIVGFVMIQNRYNWGSDDGYTYGYRGGDEFFRNIEIGIRKEQLRKDEKVDYFINL